MNHINISTSPGFLAWEPAAWLQVSGEDAGSFLQGQFTNDLRPLLHGGAGGAYGLWLTVKGKTLADSFVVKGVDEGVFWLGSYFSPAGVIRERLEAFVIADDVVIEDQTAAWTGLSVMGREAGANGPTGKPEGALVFRGRRVAEGNDEWVMPREMLAAVRAELGTLREWTAEEAEAQRIAAGIPAVPRDVGPGDLPNEAGLENEAISYTKGCYLGQEVMARLKSMGQVRRRLVRVEWETAGPVGLPAALWREGRQVGEVRSMATVPGRPGRIGLAMVTRMHVAAGSLLAWSVDGAPAVRVMEMP